MLAADDERSGDAQRHLRRAHRVLDVAAHLGGGDGAAPHRLEPSAGLLLQPGAALRHLLFAVPLPAQPRHQVGPGVDDRLLATRDANRSAQGPPSLSPPAASCGPTASTTAVAPPSKSSPVTRAMRPASGRSCAAKRRHRQAVVDLLQAGHAGQPARRQGVQRDQRLEGAGGAEALPQHRLHRQRRDLGQAVAEHRRQAARFAGVAGDAAVGRQRQQVDVRRCQPGVGQRLRRRPGQRLLGAGGVGATAGVEGGAVAEHLAERRRTAGRRTFRRLEHQQRRAFAGQEAVAPPVQRHRPRLRAAAVGGARHPAGAGEAVERLEAQLVRPARQHRRGPARPQQVGGVAQRLQARRCCRRTAWC